MKRNLSSYMRYLLLVFVLGIAACAKDGAAGPEGPSGPPGPAGPGGPAGPAGPEGAANVIYSAWTNVVYEPAKTPEGDTVFFRAIIPAPKLTADIISKGVIKVYINWGTSAEPIVDPLPMYDVLYYPGLNILTTFGVGDILLTSNGDNSFVGTIGTGAAAVQQYRYVLVPGGEAARTAEPAVDWNNYKAVQKYLNLKD